MLRVGLTGGLATGKSSVGRCFQELGCHLILADDLGHQVLLPGGAAFDAVVSEFGAGILDPEGRIDRRRLGQQVFGRADRLQKLNLLVHPPVIELEEQLMEEAALRDPHGIAVVEAAILIETGSYRRFHKIVLTVCNEEEQYRRAMFRDGLTREEVRQRLERQLPLREKLRFADYVIDTSGDKENTPPLVRAVYESLRSLTVL